jgi:basic membrane protein A
MDAKYLLFGIIVAGLVLLATIVALPVQPDSPEAPVVYIVYGSEKGDLSYTDSAYQGLVAAQKDRAFTTREFTPANLETLPGLLNSSAGPERPGLVITVGYQYAGLNRELSELHPGIRFLAIDQPGIGSETIRAYEIVSYGNSYLAGVLAASATRTGRVGILMGARSEVLDLFLAGYNDGARAVNASVVVDAAYVREDSPDGFTDPLEAGRIAEGMYRNGTDVIYLCAGFSNMGGFDAARAAPGRYIIGTDSDQSPMGPEFVLASAVKHVDRVVYSGIADYLDGSFTGGNVAAGLIEGTNGIVLNPEFAFYNETVSAWEARAGEEEAGYLASRQLPVRE